MWLREALKTVYIRARFHVRHRAGPVARHQASYASPIQAATSAQARWAGRCLGTTCLLAGSPKNVCLSDFSFKFFFSIQQYQCNHAIFTQKSIIKNV